MSPNALSTLELLGEIKLLANQKQENPSQAQALKPNRSHQSTQELQFALNDIKATIIDSAANERESLLTQKQNAEEEKIYQLKRIEAQAIEKAQKEAEAEAEAKQRADQYRVISQLRLQYQAELALNPKTTKPQALEAFDAQQEYLKNLHEATIKEGLIDIDIANTTALQEQSIAKETTLKKQNRLTLSIVLAILFVGIIAIFASYLFSSPMQGLEEQRTHLLPQPSTTAPQQIPQQPVSTQHLENTAVVSPTTILSNQESSSSTAPNTNENIDRKIVTQGSDKTSQKSNKDTKTNTKGIQTNSKAKKLKFQIDQNANDIQYQPSSK